MWDSVRPFRQEPEHGEKPGLPGAKQRWKRTCPKGVAQGHVWTWTHIRAFEPRVSTRTYEKPSTPGSRHSHQLLLCSWGSRGGMERRGLSLPHKCSEPLEKGTLRLKISREPICSQGPQCDGRWRFESRELTFLCSRPGGSGAVPVASSGVGG